MGRDDRHSQDRAAIEELHRRDMTAAAARDYRTLASLLSMDAVLMPPDSEFVRGREAVESSNRRMAESLQQQEIVEYRFDFEEVEILGDHAFEWGTLRGVTRDRRTGKVQRANFKILRILRKHPSGEWQVHRSMWNASPPPDGANREEKPS